MREVSAHNRTYKVTEGYDWFWDSVEKGTWEPATFKIFDTFLKKDRNMLDIGAWIGPTALYASDRAKTVYAFEPDKVAYHHLTENLLLNEVENVVTYPVAVANSWKQLSFGPKNSFGDSMSSELWGGYGIKVPAISLEAVILDLNPNFIKIDIEGGEKTIFDKSILALAECKPTIYLSLHTPWFEDWRAFRDSIKTSLEMYPYFYDENLRPIKLEDAFVVNAFTSVVASFEKLN